MKAHVQIVTMLHIALGIFSFCGGLALFAFFCVVSELISSQGNPAIASIIRVMAAIIGGCVTILALPSIIGGWALMTGRRWGRPVVLIFGALQ